MSSTLPSCGQMPTPNPLPDPNELAVAVRVGQKMLARYATVDSGDIFVYAQAHGGLTEALRILLRALGAEGDNHVRGAAKITSAGTNGTSQGWTSVTEVQVPEGEQGSSPVRTPGDETASATVSSPRCPAAHADDPTPCAGPVVVTVLDTTNSGANGCEHHGARLLASLDRGRVYALPDAPDGAAIRVLKAADGTRPFPWVDGPRTRDEQLSRAETRTRGERP